MYLSIIKIIIFNKHIHQWGRCSIVVRIPACHKGDPGSIPGKDASCLAIVMSHPEGFYPSSQSAGYSVRSEREGNWIATSALGLHIPGGRCSIVVSIPLCHVDDPGSIPRNGTSIQLMVISHTEGFYPSSQSAGYSYVARRGKLNSNIDPWTEYQEVVVL